MGATLDVVNQYYEVTFKQKNAEAIRPLLAENFVFIGPLARTEGIEAYVELNAHFLPAHMETRMMQQFEQGDEVCSIYELELQTPSGERLIAPMADWIKVRGGKMVEQHIYYDAREFEKAFAPST